MLPLSRITDLQGTSFWQWNPEDNDSLYFLQNSNLFLLETFTNQKELQKKDIFSSQIQKNIYALKVTSAGVFFLIRKEKGASLGVLFTGEQSASFLKDFPDFPIFGNAPDPYLLVLEKENQKGLLINTASRQIILEDNITGWQWSKKLKNNYWLAYYNNLEIYIFDPTRQEKKLLLRTSQNIKKVKWYPDFNHLLYLIDNQLFIRDLESESLNRYLVLEGDIKDFAPLEDEKNILVSGKINGQKGIFKVNLR